MRYLVIFALGMAVGTFGTVKTLHVIQKAGNTAIETTTKVIEGGSKIIDTTAPKVKEGIKKVKDSTK